VQQKLDIIGETVVVSIRALQVISLFEKQGNVLIRALICGPKSPVWVAGKVPALVASKILSALFLTVVVTSSL
jgi:hypothetical protein